MKVRLNIWLITLLVFIYPFRVFAGTYTWTGGTNTDWTNSGNWTAPLFASPTPASGDDIVIAPLLSLFSPSRYPVIKSTETITCKSLTFQNLSGASITVNGTLIVTGNILQAHNTGSGDVDALITGTGIINCAALNVGDTGVPGALSSAKNTSTVKCNITQLNITNSITVNSASSASKTNNAVLNITNDNGPCTVTAAALSVTTPSPISTTLASATLTNASTGAIILKFTGSTPVSIGNSTYGAIDFYTGAGTGSSTVEYAGASAQTVYTSSTSGLNTAPSIYQHIKFSGAGVKTANTNNLTISGDWTSSGGNVNCTSPTVTFQGTAQTLNDNGAGGVTFKNVIFNNGGTKTITGTTTAGFSVSGTGVLTLAAATTLTVGAGGKLILISDATGTASVAAIPTGCSITGNVNVQRYFRAGTIATNTRNYRLLSSPVNANTVTNNAGATAYYTLGYLNNNPGIFIAGPGGTGSGFTVNNATPTMYLYKESLPASNTSFNSGNFKGIANIAGATTTLVYNDAGTTADVNATLYAGNGYMLYYAGNNTTSVTSTTLPNKQFRVGGNYIDPDAGTATAIGTLNQGDVPVRLWATGLTALSNVKSGFNLVGNPYASTIDWDTFSSTSSSAAIYGPYVSKSIYIFNYTNKNYGVYQAGGGSTGTNNASRYIASGQGFFVIDTVASGASLTFREAAKTTAQPESLGSSRLLMGLPAQTAQVPQILRLKLTKDSINTDESILLFEAGAKNAFEQGDDAPRLNGIGNITSLATYASDNTRQLAINHLHSIDSTTRVKLYALSAVGANTLSINGFDSVDPRYDAYLIDHYKNDSLQTGLNLNYSFNIRSDSTASYGANRFELAFHKKSSLKYRLLSFTGTAGKGEIELKWKAEKEQNLVSFTLEKVNAAGVFNTLYSLQSDGSGAYSWTDKSPVNGKNTYRLKRIDAFDQVSYTELPVDYNTLLVKSNVITVYPNPVTTQFNVRINLPKVPANVRLKVFAPSGFMLVNQVFPANNIQQSAEALQSGIYVIEISDTATRNIIGHAIISKP